MSRSFWQPGIFFRTFGSCSIYAAPRTQFQSKNPKLSPARCFRYRYRTEERFSHDSSVPRTGGYAGVPFCTARSDIRSFVFLCRLATIRLRLPNTVAISGHQIFFASSNDPPRPCPGGRLPVAVPAMARQRLIAPRRSQHFPFFLFNKIPPFFARPLARPWYLVG